MTDVICISKPAYTDKQAEALKTALDEGLFVVEFLVQNGFIISCDHDNPITEMKQIERVLDLERSNFRLENINHQTKSRSNTNKHTLYVLEKDAPLCVRSTLAVYLGSDPIREAILQERIHRGAEHYGMIFEKIENLPNVAAFLLQHAKVGEYIIHVPKKDKK